MNKTILQNTFKSFEGYAYKFNGSIPENTKPFEHIASQYDSAEGGSVKQLSISQINNVYYVYSPVEIDDEDFTLVCDLSNPPTDGIPYEPPVAEEQQNESPPEE